MPSPSCLVLGELFTALNRGESSPLPPPMSCMGDGGDHSGATAAPA